MSDRDGQPLIREIVKTKLQMAILLLIAIGAIMLFVAHWFLTPDSPSYSVVQNLASVMIATGVVSIIYEFYIRRQFASLLRSESQNLLDQVFPVVSNLEQLGIAAVYKDRGDIPWSRILSQAREEIAILDTTISFWAHVGNSEHLFREALNNGCRVRLLVLDPDSDYAAQRGRDLGYGDPMSFPNEIRSGVDLMLSRFESIEPGRFEIKTYNAMPTCVLIRVDDALVLNLFLHNERSRTHLHFQLTKHADSSACYWNHFLALWGASTSYPSYKKKKQGSGIAQQHGPGDR